VSRARLTRQTSFRVVGCALRSPPLIRRNFHTGSQLDRNEPEAAVFAELHVTAAVYLQSEQFDLLALCDGEQRDGVTGRRRRDEQVLRAPDAGHAAPELRWRRHLNVGLAR